MKIYTFIKNDYIDVYLLTNYSFCFLFTCLKSDYLERIKKYDIRN